METSPNFDTKELEEISGSVDNLIKEDREYDREKYWEKYETEFSKTVENRPHYKHGISGNVSVFGNAITIQEKAPEVPNDEKLKDHLIRLGRKKRKPPTRKKGDIKGFSKNSRLRMQKKMNRVDFKDDCVAYFITLTYPDPFPTDGEIYKTDLDLFLKRLKTEFGCLCYLWKLEVQFKRGAPHFHLIIFFKKRFNIEYVKKWLSRNWFEVVQRNREEKNMDHLIVGTNCKIVKTLRQLTNYVSKYLVKKEDDDKLENQGRYWGCSRNWGDTILENFTLSGKQLICLRRLLKRYLRKTNRRMAKKTTNCPNIEIWANWKFLINAIGWSILMNE